MTELLTVLATPAWAYLALFGFLAVDALVPVIPIQAIMITSGALTVYGGLDLVAVIAVGASGMFTGDSIAFVLGRSTGARLSALRDRFAPVTTSTTPGPGGRPNGSPVACAGPARS